MSAAPFPAAPLCSLDVGKDSFSSLSFLPGETGFVAAAGLKQVYFVSVRNDLDGQLCLSKAGTLGNTKPDQVAWQPGSSSGVLAVADRGGPLFIFDAVVQEKKESRELCARQDLKAKETQSTKYRASTCIAWDPHHRSLLACASPDYALGVWDTRTPSAWSGSSNAIDFRCGVETQGNDITFSPFHPHLVAVATQAANTGTLLLFDQRYPTVSMVAAMTPGFCTAAAFHPLYCDLLAYSYKLYGNKRDARVEFLDVSVNRAVAPSAAQTPVSSASASVSSWCSTGPADLPSVTCIAPQARLRWRPLPGPNSSISPLWFASYASQLDCDAMVWDALNPYCPVLAARGLHVDDAKKPQLVGDLVWLNSSTVLTCGKNSRNLVAFSLQGNAVRSRQDELPTVCVAMARFGNIFAVRDDAKLRDAHEADLMSSVSHHHHHLRNPVPAAGSGADNASEHSTGGYSSISPPVVTGSSSTTVAATVASGIVGTFPSVTPVITSTPTKMKQPIAAATTTNTAPAPPSTKDIPPRSVTSGVSDKKEKEGAAASNTTTSSSGGGFFNRLLGKKPAPPPAQPATAAQQQQPQQVTPQLTPAMPEFESPDLSPVFLGSAATTASAAATFPSTLSPQVFPQQLSDKIARLRAQLPPKPKAQIERVRLNVSRLPYGSYVVRTPKRCVRFLATHWESMYEFVADERSGRRNNLMDNPTPLTGDDLQAVCNLDASIADIFFSNASVCLQAGLDETDSRFAVWLSIGHVIETHDPGLVVELVMASLDFAARSGDAQLACMLFVTTVLWWRRRWDLEHRIRRRGHSDEAGGETGRRTAPTSHSYTDCPLLSASWRDKAFQWMDAYGPLLQHMKLWVEWNELAYVFPWATRTDARLPDCLDNPCFAVSAMAQEKSTAFVHCGTCERVVVAAFTATTMPDQPRTTDTSNSSGIARPPPRNLNASCSQCKPKQLHVCIICEEPVRGMYLWMKPCGHGGHPHHIEAWLAENEDCPKCGTALIRTQ